MESNLRLGDVTVAVTRKDIKNIHLSVHPPTGRVTIAAPLRTNMDALRVFAISRLGWIRRQQGKLQTQERESPREFLNRESHFVWGQRYLLRVIETEGPARVEIKHKRLELRTPSESNRRKNAEVLEAWYRDQIRAALPALLAKWQRIMGVSVDRIFVQRMKTKWGSCNPHTRNIRLNTDLAKKPRECLEYLLVHEMVHLIEPTHNERFVALMDQYMPRWKHRRETLNQLPVRQEAWGY